MGKHTAGPWNTEFVLHAKLTKDSHVHCLTDEEGFVVGLISSWVNDPSSKEEAMANARLIAAAPEMLEALKVMYEEFGSDYKELVCKAIEKATGEYP